MAMMPSIMSWFSAPATTQVAAAQNPVTTTTQPGPVVTPAQQVAAIPGNPGNTTVPSSTTPSSDGSVAAIPAVASPGNAAPTLENFADLWKLPEPDPKAPGSSLVPNFNLDAAGVMTAVNKVDFAQHIPAETITKALSGDVESFKAALNTVARLAFGNSTLANGEMVKNSFTNAESILNTRVLPSALREREVAATLLTDNPIFSDPAAAPMLTSLKTQFQAKYPTASPAEIAQMAGDYLDGFATRIAASRGGKIVPLVDPRSSRAVAQETDWDTYFAQG
jgi:hypothetical protein